MDAASSPARRRLVPRLSGADRAVLRLAFAGTFAFAVAALRDWDYSFLAPMLAVQILAGSPARPTLVQGLLVPLTILVATRLALAVSGLFAGAPPVLLGVVGLALCWTFYGQRRGAPALVVLLVQVAFCCVPLISTISRDLAREFSDFLLGSSIAAVVTVWLAHALFPAPAAPSPPPPAGLPPGDAARIAISDALVLLPLLATFAIGGDINNIVIMMITLNLLREVDPAGGARLALAILVANLLGGIAAVLAWQVVRLSDSLPLFLMAVLTAGLVFGGRMARGGPAAPVYAVAFATFLLVLGISVTPLPGAAEELVAVRLLKIGIASLYALGALSLVAGLRRRTATG